MRPENTITQNALPRTIKSTRRLLAYLLRATKLRMSRDAIGESRWRNLTTEISGALLPLVMSERSALGFYHRVCERFSVDPGGDTDHGPIEVWLPEGRARWDHACAALDRRDLVTVIRESPEFFATFACSQHDDGVDDLFDAFPDPIQTQGYRPTLPKQLISPRCHRAVWTLTSPMFHGSDVKTGNMSLFRRHTVPDPLTGTTHEVPVVSGNAIRGMLRDVGMGKHLQLLGLKSTDIPTTRAHSLLAGGAIESGADTGTVNNVIRARARELCPPWDLVAGCIDQQIMSGRARIGDATLVCRETAWKTQPVLAPELTANDFAAALPSCDEMMVVRQLTRHKHADIPGADGVQMLVNFELIREGNQMLHTLQIWGLDGVEPTTASFLTYLLDEFREIGSLGVGASRGFGSIAFDGYMPGNGAPPLPSSELYLNYVESRRQEMIDWAMGVGEPAAPAPKSRATRKPLAYLPRAAE